SSLLLELLELCRRHFTALAARVEEAGTARRHQKDARIAPVRRLGTQGALGGVGIGVAGRPLTPSTQAGRDAWRQRPRPRHQHAAARRGGALLARRTPHL